MKINGSVALVTGANRGLGQVYSRELIARGAAKVYGARMLSGALVCPGGSLAEVSSRFSCSLIRSLIRLSS